MSSSIEYIVTRLQDGAPSADLPQAIIRFDFGESGAVTVDARQHPATITPNREGPEPDCTLTMAAPHLELILRGRVSVGAGFMKFVRGSSGELVLTMRIQRLLRAALAQQAVAG